GAFAPSSRALSGAGLGVQARSQIRKRLRATTAMRVTVRLFIGVLLWCLAYEFRGLPSRSSPKSLGTDTGCGSRPAKAFLRPDINGRVRNLTIDAIKRNAGLRQERQSGRTLSRDSKD